MRLLIAALLVVLAAPAFAACQVVRDPDWGKDTAAQAAYALCLQLELNRSSIEAQRQAQVEADYRLRLQMLELEQRMREQMAALQQLQLPTLPPIAPAF